MVKMPSTGRLFALLIAKFAVPREDFRRQDEKLTLLGEPPTNHSKVVSFRGSFPRNPVSGSTFELVRRDSLFGCGRYRALRRGR